MGKQPFEIVEADERRFQLMERPDFGHKLTKEQLATVDEITGERWILLNVMGQKLDWLIENHVQLNNNLYALEAEVIRSKKFRHYVWTRVTLVVAGLVIVWNIFLPVIRKFFGLTP